MENAVKEEVDGFLRSVRIVPAKMYGSTSFDTSLLHIGVTRNCKAIVLTVSLGISPRGCKPSGAIGLRACYHSPVSLGHDGDGDGNPVVNDCCYTNGDCYMGQWFSIAQDWGNIFFEEGLDAVWPLLTAQWEGVFGETE